MCFIEKKYFTVSKNDTFNLWKNDAIRAILQEVVSLQSDQKLVVNYMWLTTLMLSSS